MELLEESREYLLEKTNNPSGGVKDVSITIEYGEERKYEVEGKFPELKKEKERAIAPKKRFEVLKDSELYSTLTEFCETFDANVLVKNAEIETVHINETVREKSLPTEDWPYYTKETADARVFVSVSQKTTEEIQNELLDLMAEVLQTVNVDISGTDIQTVDCLFSDFAPYEIVKIQSVLQTANPHRYYTQVSSVDEFISRKASDEQEADELKNNEEYEVRYFAREFETKKLEQLEQTAVAMMRNFTDSTFESDWEYIIEPECISIGSNDRIEGPQIKYFVHIPISSGEIGKTY